ncbi:MAG: hypothetical protein KKC75_02180 [Nanoarchaeota archaeon]|nr:hypothetical protein [Nanoarchaeota archaeon]MBU1004629.1 hypothetical protein [Nanoarchaeota archaeon]MBU1946183.1 hypothetical protein [Nanoarchaeota archaeon]
MEEVKFEVDKGAFKGPFKCHGMNTKLVSKEMSIDGNVFAYSVWKCAKCSKEYLDSSQARKMEAIWTFEKMAKDDVLSMERALNYDGKMFFIRFPKELTKNWKQGDNACIKMIDTKRFLVEVKC